MAPSSVWLDVDGVPVAGLLAVPPDDQARGSVVICPPLGHEHIVAYDSVRLLSERLVDRGFAVLRFDYPGTGDSADPPEGAADDLLPWWLRAVSTAVGWCREEVEGPGLLVGLRMGALLAAVDGDLLSEVEGCILWDPCWTGRAFIRKQQALYQMMTGDHAAQGVPSRSSIPGYTYPVATLDRLHDLDISDTVPKLPGHTLVLTRDEALRRKVSDLLDSPDMTVEHVDGQQQLLDVGSPDSVVPVGTIERIVHWCSERFPSERHVIRQRVSPSHAVVAPGVIEFAERLGPHRLFSVTTIPQDGAMGPTLLFLNVAAEVHIGPARQWVELARRLAAHGFRSVRLDLTGLGETPARPGERRRRIYSPLALADVREVLDEVVDGDGREAILVGLCSGAYLALEAGATFGLAGVVSINAILDIDPEVVQGGDAADGRVVVARPRAPLTDRAAGMPWVRSVAERAPAGVWRAAHHLGLRRSPAEGLRAVTDRVGRTLLLCDPTDAETYLRRGRWIVDRALRQGTLTVHPVAVDHALMTMPGRAIVADAVVNWVSENFGRLASVPAAPEGVAVSR